MRKVPQTAASWMVVVLADLWQISYTSHLGASCIVCIMAGLQPVILQLQLS